MTRFTAVEPLPFAVGRSALHGHRRFPTRLDYERALASHLGVEEPWDNPELVASVMRHWHATGQTGCLFARHLSRVHSQAQWPSLVVPGRNTGGLKRAIANHVVPAIATAIESEQCEILSLGFPSVESIADLKTLCRLLTKQTDITAAEDRSWADAVIVALRLDITGTGQLAWIMAFGPFVSWPATRRGPVLEFVIRTKPKPACLFHRLNRDPTAAHLADARPGFDDAQMELVFARTERATRDVLGHGPDHRSAAKATFSFAPAEWDQPL